MRIVVMIVTLLGMVACQSPDADEQDTVALNGVWRGVVSDAKQHESLQAHVLDGLMLAVSHDGERAHSGELRLRDGHLEGLYAARDEVGEREQDYQLRGLAWPGDSMEADLYGPGEDAALSLFYNADQSYEYASYARIAGLYYLDSAALQISLSVGQAGWIEGYDDAGCAYFGYVEIPHPERNVYAISMEVEGCALAGEFAFGIGSVRDVEGWPQLVLPVWFDEQDRVEPWILERV